MFLSLASSLFSVTRSHWPGAALYDPSFYKRAIGIERKLDPRRRMDKAETQFFASIGIEVVAIDTSKVAIDGLSKTTIEKTSSISPMIHNLSEDILFNDSYFNVGYSHMFLSFPHASFNLLFRQVISQFLSNR